MNEEKRIMEVAAGDDLDRCGLCGIERRYAGYIKASCGDYLREPGCFVVGDLEPRLGVATLQEPTE